MPNQTVKYLRVLVRRDPVESIPTEIAEHELPILTEVMKEFGDECVQILSESSREVALDPAEEWERLKAKYGKHKESKQFLVQIVYGLKTSDALARALGVEHDPVAIAKRETAVAASEIRRSRHAA